MNLDALASRLHEEGLVADAAVPPQAAQADAAPWYTRAMLGFAGWLAGLFLMGFLAGVIVIAARNAPAMMLTGLVLCGAAAWIYRVQPGVVVAQIALAVSMAGQAFFGFALMELSSHFEARAGTGIALFQAMLVVVMRNALHRVLSTLFAAAAAYWAFDVTDSTVVGAALGAFGLVALALTEPRWRAGPAGDALGAVMTGLALALTAWTLPALAIDGPHRAGRMLRLDGIAYGAALLAFAWGATRRVALPHRALALAAAAVFAAAAWPAPGVVACALAMLVAYGAAQPGLVAWAAAAMIGYLGFFYYQLQQTLLEKSVTLALAGAALLAARAVLLRLEARAP